jgi:glutamyl-tRNA(Gln) amidotransferase subunit E
MALPFKPFEKMTPEDYAQIGFRCGLEVHRQLLTETKLFCRCPAGRYSNDYDTEILRHMRPTLSELGEYDGTALMEKKTRKNIYYRIHHGTVCTYEFDDTPPFLIDDDALDITLELCLLFNLNIVGELHIARKQYLDGSIPTGFQRTGIVGVTGSIPFGQRMIGIRQLSIEEDACREVSDVGHDRVYLTDRLGMPLIEVVTEPDMRTPAEAAEVCQLIRRICRSTGKVRTGYGAARQDVNVSVRGGTRVEIKGVPQIWRIPRLVYNEAQRQWALLQIRAELKHRGVTPKTFHYTAHDVTRVVAQVQWEPVRAAVEAGLRVKCVVLKRFGGLLNTVTQEHTTFAKEFSDRVRVIACLTRLPNITHSDTATEALAARDWANLRKRTRADAADALLVVWGSEQDTETACNEIAIRAREATQGVPSDTRQPLKDGTTGFERVLPGADRMYPDTDLPPLAISAQRVARVRAGLPERVWEREARLRELGVPADTLAPLLTSRHGELFFRIVRELKVDPKLAAVVLVQRLKAWRRAGLDVTELGDDDIYGVFEAYAGRRLTREGMLEVLECMMRKLFAHSGSSTRAQAAMNALGYGSVSDADPSALVTSTLNGLDRADFESVDDLQRYAMGLLMRDLRGRVDGRRVAELVSAGLSQTPRAAVEAGVNVEQV